MSEALLRDIAEYCRRAKMAESTFGRHAVNDGKLVSRLRLGGRVTTDTVERVRAFIASEPQPAANGDPVPALLPTAAPAAGSRCGRVPQNGFGRSFTSCPMRISVRRYSGASLRCSLATPGLPSRLWDQNGGSRYQMRCGSATTPLSQRLPVAFLPRSPIRRRCRSASDPTCLQNIGSRPRLSH